MNAKERADAWRVDQLDPNNWVRIPEFGVSPREVNFEGFAFPIVSPSPKNYELRQLLRVHVRTVRELVQRDHNSLATVRELWVGVLDLLPDGDWGTAQGRLKLTRAQRVASYYCLAQSSVDSVDRIFSFDDTPRGRMFVFEQLAFIADVIRQWAMLKGDTSNAELEAQIRAYKLEASIRARRAADKRHDRPGGSRQKVAAIRAIWQSGKYSARDLCALEECDALGMSFSAARKALINVPIRGA